MNEVLNFIQPRDAWDKLSMREKAEMMKVAVRNGIYNLNDIREKYNEFAEGGNIYDGESEPTQRMITTSGSGYLPPTINAKEVTQQVKQDVRQRLYDNIIPFGYNNPVERISSALLFNKPSKYNVSPASGNYDALDELWANYLQIPQDKRHYDSVLKVSKYKPTKSKDRDAIYYSLPLDDDERQWIVNHALSGTYSSANPELGYYTIDKGEDEYGPYASYYDKWDINPFRGITSVGRKVSSILGLDKIDDISLGIGKPVEVYDRIYYNALGQAEPARQLMLPEIIIYGKKHSLGGPIVEAANEYRHGGGIHIKKENRGKFTRLKERTGHSASWFKEHGTPAQKRMAVFELNARKWKHGLGGNLFEEAGQMQVGLNVPRIGLDVQGWPDYTIEQIIANGEREQQQRQAEANKSFLEKLQDILDTKVQVQATPGTATGYATTGQYMPKSESTVGRQLIEGTATVSSPFISSAALSLSPGSAFWMNPVTQQIAKSTLGGVTTDTISTVATGNTIGKNVRETIGWQPNNEWVKLGYELLTDMANPGYMFGTKRPGFDIVPSPIVPSKGSAQMDPGRNFGTFRPETFNNWGSESLTHLTKDYAVKVPKQSRTPIDVGPKTFNDLGWRYRAAVNEKLAANKIAGFEPYEYIGYHTTENGYTPVFRQKRLTLMGENTSEGKIFNEEALSDIEREMSTHSGLWKSWNIGDYGPAHNIGKNAEGVGRLYDATYSREPITWIMQNFPRKWEISPIGNARLFGNTLERSANE